MMKRYVIAATLFILAAFAFAGGSDEESDSLSQKVTVPVNEQVQTDDAVTVAVQITLGSVRIVGAESGRVRVSGMVGEDVEAVDLDRAADGTIEVTVQLPDRDNYSRMAIAAELEIAVPGTSNVRVQTPGAQVEVQNVTGNVDVRTVSGSISVTSERAAGDVSTSTIGGEVTVSGPFGSVQSESVMSDIVLEGFRGAVRAASTGGRLTIRDAYVTAAELRTGMGTISAECDLAPDAAFRATTAFGGNIEVVVPRSFEGLVTLTSGPGGIDYSGFTPDSDVVTVFEDVPISPFASLPGIDTSVTTDEAATDEPLRGAPMMFAISGGDGERRFAGIGRSLLELRVGEGGARIYLDCQGTAFRTGDDGGATAGVVLRTR